MTYLVLGVILLAFSLLAVVDPPAPVFWMLSVPAKEWGWVFALLGMGVAWGALAAGGGGLAVLGAVLALAAATLYLVPLVQGVRAAGAGAFSWRRLFLGTHTPRAAVRTLTYAMHDGAELLMDLYPAHAAGPAPVVLVIHGGAWRSGDRKQLPKLNHYLAARGYAVAAINYRLMPRWRFPAPIDDVRAAIRYLKEHGPELGVDPEQIVLLGRSAGAQLALVAGYSAHDPAIRGVVGYYGPFALDWGYHQPCKVLNPVEVVGSYLGGSPEQVPHRYRQACPTCLVGPNTPPTLLIQGGADTMVAPEHSYQLTRKLKEAGRPYRYVEVPAATHGSDLNFSGPFGQISTRAVERFLHEVTALPEASKPVGVHNAGQARRGT